MSQTDKTNRESWNKHSRRYISENPLPLDEVDYCNGEEFPTESNLQLIGNPKGLRVLELGSGTCNCGIALAQKGAIVTCVDISDEQLAVGQQFEQNRGVDIECIQGDFVDVQELPAATYDLVLSVCALEYAEDIDVVFGGVYESLKPSGRFIFSQTHPIMQALDAGELSPEDNAPSNYSYRGVVEWKWKQDDDFSFISYRRPLSDIVNALTNCGLRIEKTLDLYPLKSNPEWGAVESEIRNRWPSVLVMVSSKSRFTTYNSSVPGFGHSPFAKPLRGSGTRKPLGRHKAGDPMWRRACPPPHYTKMMSTLNKEATRPPSAYHYLKHKGTCHWGSSLY